MCALAALGRRVRAGARALCKGLVRARPGRKGRADVRLDHRPAGGRHGERQAAPARPRGARPGVLYRGGLSAPDRGGRRPGRDLPGDGQQGRRVHVYSPGNSARSLHRRVRGDEPLYRERRGVLRLRLERPREGPWHRGRVRRAHRLQQHADRDLRPLRGRDGRVHVRLPRPRPPVVVVVPGGRAHYRALGVVADRLERARPGRCAQPRGADRRALRFRHRRRSRPARANA